MSVERETATFEVEFSLSLAAVPAWSPVGIDADRYRVHLHGDEERAPLPETLLHHQERWGHVGDYDDFVDLLRLERLSADSLAALAYEAGADRVIATARSADGWCWWDTSDDRSVARRGPRRDVVGEMAAAARRRGLAAGIRYDATGATDPAQQLGEVLAHYDLDAISGTWDPQFDSAIASTTPGVDVDIDRHPEESTGWRTRRDCRPAGTTEAGPWLSALPTGSGFGANRADPSSRRAHAPDVIAQYVEMLQGGGTLRVVVPLFADGTPHPHDVRMLRRVGDWIRTFGPTLRSASGWNDRVEGTALFDTGEQLLAVTRTDRRLLPELTDDVARIVRITELGPADSGSSDLPFDQDAEGLHLHSFSTARTSSPEDHMPCVLLLDVVVDEPPVQLFSDEEPGDVPLAPLLDGHQPGDIVHLGDARYVGSGTLRPGVTLRGLGADRTRVAGTVSLSRGARLEHLAADDVRIPADAVDTMLLGCTVGSTLIAGDGAAIKASRIGSIEVAGARRVTISRCRSAAGDRPTTTAITVRDARDIEIDGCSFIGVESAIDIADSDGVAVRGCTVRDAGTGIRVTTSERAHICASRIERATRAIDVAGGLATLIDGNVVVDADSGVVVRDGAADCIVSGNYWERCRIGALLWEADDVRVMENVVEDLAEPENEVQRGPT